MIKQKRLPISLLKHRKVDLLLHESCITIFKLFATDISQDGIIDLAQISFFGDQEIKDDDGHNI